MSEYLEPDELSDLNTAEIGQEYSIDSNTNTERKDEETSTPLVSESEVNKGANGSCSSTQNQGVDVSIIVMSMLFVPIVFRRLRR